MVEIVLCLQQDQGCVISIARPVVFNCAVLRHDCENRRSIWATLWQLHTPSTTTKSPDYLCQNWAISILCVVGGFGRFVRSFF